MKYLPKCNNKKRKPVDSIHLCFKWIYTLLFYAGCLCFRLHGKELQLTTASVCYTKVMRIAFIVSFFGAAALKFTKAESAEAIFGHLSPVLKFVLLFECTISSVTYVEVSLLMDRNKYAHMQLAQRFQVLDQRMQQHFPNINWNYGKSQRKYTPLTFSVICFYFVVSFIYLFNLSNCQCDYLTTSIIAMSYAVITVAPGSVGFLHLGAMDMLRIRFRLISKLLQQHYAMMDANGENGANERELHLHISHLIGYFQSYVQFIPEMNNVFGYVCAAGLFYDFGIMTNLTFLLCQKASESHAPPKEYIFILLFMLPRMYKVIITAVYGYIAHKTQRDCLHTISRYVDHFRDATHVRSTMENFWHWRMQNNYTLTIGKIISCNLILLYMIMHGIANYVIVLIQLQFQQNNIMKAQDVELVHRRAV